MTNQLLIERDDIHLCKCGCGREVEWKSFYKNRGWSLFIQGHNGTKESNEKRIQTSKALKVGFYGMTIQSRRKGVLTKIKNGTLGMSSETAKKYRNGTWKRTEKHKQIQREGAIRKVEKLIVQYGKIVPAWVGLNEKRILDEQEIIYDIKILRQFHIIGYVVDGYCKENNTVYEVDETAHFNKDGTYKEKDIKRQKRIEKTLNCKFVRIRTSVIE